MASQHHPPSWFSGRRLAIATKHRKEQAIAPILERELGVRCFTPDGLDTDALGTFTGEIERTLDPLAAAREKCRLAMDVSGCDLAVASEGSFGMHAALFFVHAGDEILLLCDRKNDLEITARELSTSTNFNGTEVGTEAALLDFAARVGFPSHALILRNAEGGTDYLAKGITTQTDLIHHFHHLINQYGAAWVETDMRALFNPMRMQAIAIAAQKLAERAKTPCPACQAPGFGPTGVKTGLPCSWCGLPTRSVLSERHACQKCDLEEEHLHPYGRTAEDPQYCDYCNP